jgi:hypothetical protein
VTLIDDMASQTADLTQLTKDLNEAIASPAEVKTVEAVAATTSKKPDHVPDKFWNVDKGELDVEKLVSSYTNLESTYGRMANDLGTQRKLTDRLLDLKRAEDLRTNGDASTQTAQAVEVKGTELLDDPAGVITRVVNHTIQQRDQQNAQQTLEQQQAARFAKFQTDHPDFNDVAQSTEFKTWVEASPSRKRAGGYASRGDVDAADDLLTEYKAGKKVVTQTNTEQAGIDAARNAALETSTSAGKSTTGKSGKIYRRVDLLELKQRNSDLYYSDDYQKEILAAYNEGRVK